MFYFSYFDMVKFALGALRGELLERKREKKREREGGRDPHNLKVEASIGEGLY